MFPTRPSPVPPVTLLEWLFTGHPARMIRLTKTEDGQKRVVTYPRGARTSDYAKHLAIGATSGPGALGLFPGYPEKNREEQTQRKSRWLVQWAAMDFDAVSLDSLHGLIQALWDDGLPCYPSRGTTGRGAHLFFFFMQPVDQPKATRGLQVLSKRIEALNHPRPELRPSSPYSPGNGILLPYRGADRDGLGANPILDPVSLQPILLSDFNPVHVEAEDWLELVRSVERKGAKTPALIDKAQLESRTALERWFAELQRVTPFWQRGKRQDLVLGLAAFGCYLGLPIGKVSTDLQAFLQHQGDKDFAERLGGVERTIKKFSQGGRVSYRYWYQKAGIEVPSAAKGKPPALQEALVQLRQQLQGESWIGEGGLSDYAVYKTLVETAEQFGEHGAPGDSPEIHTAGHLTLTLSRRDLLIKSGLASLKTLYKSLQRLSKRGLVSSGTPSRGIQSGGFFLPLKPCNTHSIPPSPSSSFCQGKKSVTPLPSNYPRLVFRRGKGLGKLAERLLDGLLELGGTATLEAICTHLQRSYNQIEKPLTSLNFYNVVDFTSNLDGITLAPQWQQALMEAAKRTGALEAIARLKARFARERAERRKAFWRKISKQGKVLEEPKIMPSTLDDPAIPPLGP